MTDPTTALNSFQEALLKGVIPLQQCNVYSDLYVYRDVPAPNVSRITYVRLEGTVVTAYVAFADCAPIGRTRCFQIGYAVPEAYRSQGRAKEIVRMAIAEIKKGLKHAGVGTFYIEAIVGADNKPSQIVAEQTISETGESIIDEISGSPAFRYLLKID